METTFKTGGSRSKPAWLSDIAQVDVDLWKTLVTSHCSEPVLTAQHILGHKAADPTVELDDEFLREALTSDISEPRSFLTHMGNRFQCVVEPEHLVRFNQVISGESTCTAVFWDVEKTLRELETRGYGLAVISNLWPFPAKHIFQRMMVGDRTLGSFFHHLIYSYEVGHRKPEPQIFWAASKRTGVRPEQTLMVGDNLVADCYGAIAIGMKAAYLDRPGTMTQQEIDSLPDGILYVRSLDELLALLPETPAVVR